MKLFISYARVDKPLCKQIVHRLEDVHQVWYDRRLHAGQDWWDEIQERLDWCDGFVYLLSPESVASEYCQKEFAIAVEAGKHIFPVLIQARTDIPDSLRHLQYADLSEGMEDMLTLMNALTIAERRHRAVPPPKPPVKKPEAPPKQETSPTQALGQAADALEAGNFDNAVFVIKGALEKKPSGRIRRMLEGLLTDAEAALERQAYLREAEREYAPIRELVQREATRELGCTEFAEFHAEFPDYDPDEIADTCADQDIPDVGATHGSPAAPETPVMSVDPAILPPPFAWIEIPGGSGTMETDEGTTLSIPAKTYWIAKYPVTNAQFAQFIEAGGYKTQKWWTEAGWQQRTSDSWTEPRFWNDGQFNGREQPVVGVSWYEAIAYCNWLNEALTPNPSPTGAKITLPTEAQWQYAAQGDDGRVYPWGDEWNRDFCNTRENGLKKTTPVTQYEGQGDSPFGVADMAGNVWEWCLTEYHSRNNDINGTARRVLRGGSWYGFHSLARAAYRLPYGPGDRNLNFGFRLCRVRAGG